MNRIQEWIQNVVKSVYDPSFYRELIKGKTPGSFTYFLGLMLVFSVVLSFRAYVSLGTWWVEGNGISNVRESILSSYPDELVLEYRDGHVTSNVDEPYFIPMSESLRDFVDSEKKSSANLLVIDTSHPIVPEDIVRYDTVAILGNTALWVNDPEGGIQVNTFATLNKDPFTLDKGVVTGFVDGAFRILKPITIVGLVLLPVLSILWFSISYVLYLLFGALLVLIVGKVRNIDLSYKQSYRLGFHLITVPVCYGLLTTMFPVLEIPLVFSILLVVAAYINLEPVKAVPEAVEDVVVSEPSISKEA